MAEINVLSNGSENFRSIHWQGAENELYLASPAYEIFGMPGGKCEDVQAWFCLDIIFQFILIF